MIKPYFDDGRGIRIFHADCRHVLPTLSAGSVDLLLTDPPYGVRWHGRGTQGFGPIAGDDGMVSMADLVRPSLRLLKRNRHVYVFGLDDWDDLPIGGRAELIWDKELVGLGDCSLPWGPSHERIAFGVYERGAAGRAAGKGALSARLRKGSVLRAPRANGASVVRHPTEKPVSILREMIESSSRLGEVVLDPFMGAGSTLVAARLEGRLAIGIDVDERYCEIAAKRLRQSVFDLGVA